MAKSNQSFAHDDLSIKKYRNQAISISPSDGETRIYTDFFQHEIDKIFPKDIQLEENKITKKDGNGNLLWSFNAKDQIYFWSDLNNDGQDDVIMMFKHFAYCGFDGCQSYVFIAKKGGLEKVGTLTVKWETILIGPPIIENHASIYSINECLFWSEHDYDFASAYPAPNDGDEDWSPHACGYY